MNGGCEKNFYFCIMNSHYIDIHTHHPTTATTIRTVGIHPWQTEGAILPSEEAVVVADAVGEIGLDKVCGVDFKQQERLFTAQLDLAEQHQKPIVLHVVRAFEEVMRHVKGKQFPAVIFHGFIGSKEQAERALQRGYYLSFGMRSLASRKTTEALRIVPLDRLFVETDEAQTPIEECYVQVATQRGVTIEALQQATQANFRRIFNKQ